MHSLKEYCHFECLGVDGQIITISVKVIGWIM